MADFLTHIFLPLTAAYVLRPKLFDPPWLLLLGGFGLLADFDKFLGQPGLLHSVVTMGPLCLFILGVERAWRGELSYSPLIVALILSHLLLDLVAGGLVPLLYPFVTTGIGLEYPMNTVFGAGPIGITFQGPLVEIRHTAPRSGYNTYGFIEGVGVATALLFATIYLGQWWTQERSD